MAHVMLHSSFSFHKRLWVNYLVKSAVPVLQLVSHRKSPESVQSKMFPSQTKTRSARTRRTLESLSLPAAFQPEIVPNKIIPEHCSIQIISDMLHENHWRSSQKVLPDYQRTEEHVSCHCWAIKSRYMDLCSQYCIHLEISSTNQIVNAIFSGWNVT